MNEKGLVEKARELEKAAADLTDSHEEAVAVCAVAQSFLTRRASQFDVLKGRHVQEEGGGGSK